MSQGLTRLIDFTSNRYHNTSHAWSQVYQEVKVLLFLAMKWQGNQQPDFKSQIPEDQLSCHWSRC